jgi:hypothetical protein
MGINETGYDGFAPAVDKPGILRSEVFQNVLIADGKDFTVTDDYGFSSRTSRIQGNNVGVGKDQIQNQSPQDDLIPKFGWGSLVPIFTG